MADFRFRFWYVLSVESYLATLSGLSIWIKLFSAWRWPDEYWATLRPWKIPHYEKICRKSKENLHYRTFISLWPHIQWLGKSLAQDKIILYLLQVPGNSYHIYMIIYTYSMYIFDMNMRSGSHALLHAQKSEKNGVLSVLQILHVRVYKNMNN